MSINLDNTLKPIENLNVQSFEEQLDFLGTYSGFVTTDFRTVFSEVATSHLKLKDHKMLFPDWEGKNIGVIKA